MRALRPSELLDVWDAGEGHHSVERALALLRAAEPELSREELAALDVAERDRQLLRLRALVFGSRLACFAECPACGERIEFELEADALDEARPPGALEVGGVRFRLPDSEDLAAAAGCADPTEARSVLASRCILDDGATARPEVVAAVAEAMGAAAAVADVSVALACPACEERWTSLLDLPSYLWTEIGAEARRLLADVDALARAYGWSEDVVLALPARRRRAYLELALS